MSLLSDPRVVSILAEARQAHVAVETTKGPHVTPQLYALDGGDLWFFAAASTVKAKALRRHGTAGALIRAGTTSVVLVGDVTRFDAGDPSGLLTGAAGLPDAARAVAGYAVRNAPDLIGFARDAVRGRVGSVVPVRRVLFRLTPTAAAYLEDDAVVDRWGTWPSGDGSRGESLPVASGVSAAAAWLTEVGPVAGPARWDESTSRVTLPGTLVALAPPTGGQASVVIDEYGGSGPSPKRGTLLRGTGELGGDDDGHPVVSFDPEILTTWDGTETQTVRS